MVKTVCHQAMRQRRRLRRRGKTVLAWGLIALVMMFASVTMGQPAVTEALKILKLSGYAPDVMPPPFKGQTATGQAVSLTALKGRVVLINFWASWCAECGPEMPMFERLHQDFAAQGLTVLGINFQEAAPIVQRYDKQRGLTFPLVLDPTGEITRSYGVIGIPSTFLVGRDGRPVALAVGPRAWGSAEARVLIEVLLAESVAQ